MRGIREFFDRRRVSVAYIFFAFAALMTLVIALGRGEGAPWIAAFFAAGSALFYRAIRTRLSEGVFMVCAVIFIITSALMFTSTENTYKKLSEDERLLLKEIYSSMDEY